MTFPIGFAKHVLLSHEFLGFTNESAGSAWGHEHFNVCTGEAWFSTKTRTIQLTYENLP